jgi:hypothetical protein
MIVGKPDMLLDAIHLRILTCPFELTRSADSLAAACPPSAWINFAAIIEIEQHG